MSTYATTFAHLYSLWAWIALTEDLPPAKDAATRYSEFMKQVTQYEPGVEADADVMAYAESSRGASTDLKQRSVRHTALSNALNSR